MNQVQGHWHCDAYGRLLACYDPNCMTPQPVHHDPQYAHQPYDQVSPANSAYPTQSYVPNTSARPHPGRYQTRDSPTYERANAPLPPVYCDPESKALDRIAERKYDERKEARKRGDRDPLMRKDGKKKYQGSQFEADLKQQNRDSRKYTMHYGHGQKYDHERKSHDAPRGRQRDHTSNGKPRLSSSRSSHKSPSPSPTRDPIMAAERNDKQVTVYHNPKKESNPQKCGGSKQAGPRGSGKSPASTDGGWTLQNSCTRPLLRRNREGRHTGLTEFDYDDNYDA